SYPISLYQDQNKTYAQTTIEKPLYIVTPQIVKEVTKDLFELRDKRLLGIASDKLTIVRIQTLTESYSLIRQNGQWLLEQDPGTPIGQKEAALLVSRLADVPAERRITGEERLDTYDLNTPSLTITAVDERGQARGRLLVGKADHGLAYATGGGIPGVYQVRSTILTQIPTMQELINEGGK
ncbi:MAG: DUF4340 domain-containing protein, partial [Nitrospirales bacterium]